MGVAREPESGQTDALSLACLLNGGIEYIHDTRRGVKCTL